MAVNPAPETVIPSFGAIPAPQQYPSPYGVSQGGGTAGFVDKNKIINDSVQNAINQSQQLRKMYEDKKAFGHQENMNKALEEKAATEQQIRRKANGLDPNTGQPPGQPGSDNHSGFMDNVLQGLHSMGAGVKQIFGGGAPAPAAGIPAPPAPEAGPPPAAIAANTPDAPPPAMPGTIPGMDAMMNGGPVDGSGPVSGPSGFAGLIGMDAPAQASVLSREGGGPIPSGPSGVPAGMVDQNAIINAGSQNAINQSQQLTGMQRDASMYSHAQDERGAVADASMPPQVAQAHLAKEVDSLHDDFMRKSLGDDHQPNDTRGVPAPDGPYPAGSKDATGSQLNPGDIDPTSLSPTDRAAATQLVARTPSDSPPAPAAPVKYGVGSRYAEPRNRTLACCSCARCLCWMSR